jgi:Undecaprenyl-phosphate glucose phosphotransferase
VLKQRHQTFVALLCLADALMVALACAVALAVRVSVLGEGQTQSLVDALRQSLVVFAIPTVIYMLWAFGLYRPRRDRSVRAEIAQVIKASLAALVALVVFLFVVGAEAVAGWGAAGGGAAGGGAAGGGAGRDVIVLRGIADALNLAPIRLDDGRLQLLALAAALPTLLSLQRIAFRMALRAIRRRGWNLRHVAVVGTGRLGQICCRTLERNSWTGINVAFFVSHNDHAKPNATCCDRPVLGGIAELDAILERHRPDAIYLALPSARAAALGHVLRRLERFPIDVRVIPDVHLRHSPLSMVVGELDGMPILSVRESPLQGLGGFAKRSLDLLGALVALAVFAPVMGLVALAIRLTSPGPVIFRQERVSLGGQAFNIYKFRTMFHVEDEMAQGRSGTRSPATWTTRNDPRITPLGRWLRSTSLDELPQLFNVIKGDMSLVGPRPERPELIERFREDWRGYVLRQHVKAGITGWAQVNGLRGDTSLRKRLQLDLFYVRHWSLGFDLKILWLTLFRGFIHRNAH